MEQWFPETARDPELVELSYYDEIQEFLLAVSPKVNSVDISGEEYWKSLGRMQRHELLDRLSGDASE
jgi:hypothetical protein